MKKILILVAIAAVTAVIASCGSSKPVQKDNPIVAPGKVAPYPGAVTKPEKKADPIVAPGKVAPYPAAHETIISGVCTGEGGNMGFQIKQGDKLVYVIKLDNTEMKTSIVAGKMVKVTGHMVGEQFHATRVEEMPKTY